MAKRDVSPILKGIRNILLGRKHITALRFEQDLAPRTADPPVLPEGPHHRLSANYYYSRDGRREVRPDLLLAAGGGQNQLAAGKTEPTAAGGAKTPGPVYRWD